MFRPVTNVEVRLSVRQIDDDVSDPNQLRERLPKYAGRFARENSGRKDFFPGSTIPIVVSEQKQGGGEHTSGKGALDECLVFQPLWFQGAYTAHWSVSSFDADDDVGPSLAPVSVSN
jgi:hypothetical protein